MSGIAPTFSSLNPGLRVVVIALTIALLGVAASVIFRRNR